MFAAGLALIFGVMRLVNIAHGDLIVLAAYIALMTTDTLGVNPLLAILIVAPIMAAIGYCLQRALLTRTLGEDLLPPLLVTFGLSVVIQNALLELFTADSRRLNAGAIEVASLSLAPGVWIGVLPLLQFVVAVAVIAALQLLFYRTAFGRAFRATADDQSVSQLMGLDNRHVFGPYRHGGIRLGLGAARGGAGLGRTRRSAAARGNLRLCRAGEPVESARRLCRARLRRAAGLCRPGRVRAVRLDHSGRASPA